MSFCPKGVAQIKSFLDKVETLDQKLIPEITDITGKIKAVEGSPTVEAIVAIIPNGSTYENVLNTAMDKIVPALQTVGDLATKIYQWLSGKTDLESNGNLFKLASTAVAEADGNKQSESTYDTAVQTHIEGLK